MFLISKYDPINLISDSWMRRPLRIVAVDDQHFAFADVVQIAGKKRRKGRLADTSLLIADGDVPGTGCLLIGSFHRLKI